MRRKAASCGAGRKVYGCALGCHGNCRDTATVFRSRQTAVPREGFTIAWNVRGVIRPDQKAEFLLNLAPLPHIEFVPQRDHRFALERWAYGGAETSFPTREISIEATRTSVHTIGFRSTRVLEIYPWFSTTVLSQTLFGDKRLKPTNFRLMQSRPCEIPSLPRKSCQTVCLGE